MVKLVKAVSLSKLYISKIQYYTFMPEGTHSHRRMTGLTSLFVRVSFFLVFSCLAPCLFLLFSCIFFSDMVYIRLNNDPTQTRNFREKGIAETYKRVKMKKKAIISLSKVMTGLIIYPTLEAHSMQKAKLKGNINRFSCQSKRIE